MIQGNYNYNRNANQPNRLEGLLWFTLLGALTYGAIYGCDSVKKDIKDRTDYITNQEQVKQSLKTNYHGIKR